MCFVHRSQCDSLIALPLRGAEFQICNFDDILMKNRPPLDRHVSKISFFFGKLPLRTMCATRQYLSLAGGTLGTRFDGQQLGSSGTGGQRTTTDTQQIRKSQIPMSRSVRSVLELSDHSGPSILKEASQMSRNLTSLGL